jgi:wyosine [tRNA(Phe)-imidazoG37] synthetase (radical SAM superfamily)
MTDEKPYPQIKSNGNGHSTKALTLMDDAVFGYPRDFLENQFVYLVISPRAGGLSIGVNLNPVARCNLQCRYCEVDRAQPARTQHLDIERMVQELAQTLELANGGSLRQRKRYTTLPEPLLQLRHVALSGDGEPTLADNFVEAVQAVSHLRALRQFPFFKIVLLTNSTALDQPEVWHGLKSFTRSDEVWAKLDGGTQEYLSKVNGPNISIEKITANILLLGQRRSVVIQSLFPSIDGTEPSEFEIMQYARRLKQLREGGAEIPLVQIYSAARPMARSDCGHLPLKTLSWIAGTVRKVAGLRAEVF